MRTKVAVNETAAPLALQAGVSRLSHNIQQPSTTIRRGPFLPLGQRIQLYNLVIQLRKLGLSYSQIIKRILEVKRVRLSPSHISYWLHGLHTPFGNINEFDAKPSPMLSYVIGVRFSDGFLRKYGYTHAVELKVIDYEFAAETGRNLAKVLGRSKAYKPKWSRWQHIWYVRGWSVQLYDFLQCPFQELRSYVEHCGACVSAFLRAVFDAEGSIRGRDLTVHNSNKELLLYIQHLLEQHFSIETTGLRKGRKPGSFYMKGKNYRHNKQMYYLRVRSRNLTLFKQRIGLTVKRKQRRLVSAIQKQP